METLEDAILWLEPTLDLIHDCLGIGNFAEVTITSDGYFLGRLRGDCGFNYVLGIPSLQAKARSRALFDKLSPEHQSELIRKLRCRGIPPGMVGIPDPPN